MESRQTLRTKVKSITAKEYNYNVANISHALKEGFSAMHAVGMDYDRESKLYDIFTCFNEIKIPYDFHLDVISIRKNSGADPDKYSVEQVLHEIEESYTSLVQKNEWKNASGQSERDQMMTMLATFKPKTKDDGKSTTHKKHGEDGKRVKTIREPLPFKDEPGKNNDTREHKGKTFWYCDKGHGKHGPWCRHKPADHKDFSKAKRAPAEVATDDASNKKKTKYPGKQAVTFANAAATASNEDDCKVEVDLDKLKHITSAQLSAMQAAAEAVPGNKPFQDMVEGYMALANSVIMES